MAQPQINEPARAARPYRSRHGIVILPTQSLQLPRCDAFCFPYRTLPPLYSMHLSTWNSVRVCLVALLHPGRPPIVEANRIVSYQKRIVPLLIISYLPLSCTDLVIRSRDELLGLLSFQRLCFSDHQPTLPPTVS